MATAARSEHTQDFMEITLRTVCMRKQGTAAMVSRSSATTGMNRTAGAPPRCIPPGVPKGTLCTSESQEVCQGASNLWLSTGFIAELLGNLFGAMTVPKRTVSEAHARGVVGLQLHRSDVSRRGCAVDS